MNQSNIAECPKCGRHHYLDNVCNTEAWLVWSPTYGEKMASDAKIIYAETAQEAAEEWALVFGDYTIVGQGSQPNVHAMRSGTEKVYKMVVSGEAEPVYSARLLATGKLEHNE